MKIKHYVITRFLNSTSLGLGEKIFNNDIILDGINYVSLYFIPSLNNQTNKNFEIIFIINDNHNIENSNIRLLNTLDTDIVTHIIKQSNLQTFINENCVGYDYLITTRMDYDDLIYNEAVNDIQTKVMNSDLFMYGYENGLILRDNKLYKHTSKYDNGFFSVFISLSINLKKYNPTNIYSFSNHTKLKLALNEWCENNHIEYNENMFVKSTKSNCYVWVRHKNTGSSLNNLGKDERFNIETSDNDFKKKFGIEI